MSTHKNIDRVCIIITVIALLATVLFMNGKKLGISSDDTVSMSYENTLFDDSYVHTIDIEIDDWDSFLETATSEEYTAVNVTIDGEKLKNVALRAKGNTSLSTVQQLGSSRYSLKLEFDRFQQSLTYHGLDKLCLNNLIQDYTMMKDYLAYKLMNKFGAAAPLVSFVYVTINGEDWGLYLAAEAVEDSFLERNYGTNHGDLYKPDSMSMGGGRGNGREFDMREMDFDKMGMKNPFENSDDENGGFNPDNIDFANKDFSGMQPPDMGGDSNSEGGGFPGGGFGGFGMGSNDAKLKYTDDDADSYSTIFENAKTAASNSDKARLIKSLKNLSEGIENSDTDKISEAVDVDAVLRYMVVHNFLVNGDSYTGSMIHNYYLYEENGKMSMIPWDYNLAYGTFQASDSDNAVNDPIDNPLSITDGDTDRPMFDWIISCDEYTELYHQYYEEFISEVYTSGYLTDLIDTTYNMIKDYVEKDPTKFCEVSEFEKAVETIKSFVTLRCQSIEGQLNGTIGSTDAAQEENPDALIDASSITLSDMGSMGGGGGPGRGDKSSDGPGGNSGGHQRGQGRGRFSKSGDNSSIKGSDNVQDADSEHNYSKKSGDSTNSTSHSKDSSDDTKQKSSPSSKSKPGNNNEVQGSDASVDSSPETSAKATDSSSEAATDSEATNNFPGAPEGFNGGMPGDFGGSGPSAGTDPKNYIYFGGYILLLLAAIIFAKLYRNRR